jgi:hypothetical protein
LGAVVTAICAFGWAFADWPAWLSGGAAASAPLAWVLIASSHCVRHGSIVRAAAWRSLPAIAMLVLHAVAVSASIEPLVIGALPFGALAAVVAIRLQSGNPVSFIRDHAQWSLLFASERRFMRAELPAFVLNAVSLQGQVLLIGALAGSADAGRFAIAQRIAFAPTSLLGPALTDWLRARILPRPWTANVRASLVTVLAWMIVLSLAAHAGLALVTPWIIGHAFAELGAVVTSVTLILLLVGAIRLVVSPWTFLLTLRGRHLRNLAGQVALCGVALIATSTGLRSGGLVDVAWLYAAGASGVYMLYFLWCVRCASLPTPADAMAVKGFPHA